MLKPAHVVGVLLETNYREAIYSAIRNLRRKNPTGYAQASCCTPFGIIPSYVEDDKNHPWWSSEEAAATLEMLRDGAYEGVKPGKEKIRIHSMGKELSDYATALKRAGLFDRYGYDD